MSSEIEDFQNFFDEKEEIETVVVSQPSNVVDIQPGKKLPGRWSTGLLVSIKSDSLKTISFNLKNPILFFIFLKGIRFDTHHCSTVHVALLRLFHVFHVFGL